MLMIEKQEIEEIMQKLLKFYEGRKIEWSASLNLFQILIGTVISQRTRDVMTEKITKKLFERFSTPEDFDKASVEEIEGLIKKAGFYKQKAKRIKEIAEIILKRYDGKVPESREELMKLPGVGAKTSAITTVYGFGKNDAIPVDTHVHRISNRIGIVKTKTPEETEKELMKKMPRKYWNVINHLFVIHGQSICLPMKPRCNECPIKEHCRYFMKFEISNK